MPPTNSSYTFLTASTLNGGFATFYYPSNLAAMQINYTANSATLQVTNILASVTPFSTNAPKVTGGSFTANFSGVAGANYVIEYSDTFSPFNWQFLTNIVASPGGAVNFQDLLAQPERFYRAYYLGD